MFICSNANLMGVQNAGEIPRQLANDFFQKQNGYVMLEVQNGDETYHITKEMLKNGKSYRKDRGSTQKVGRRLYIYLPCNRGCRDL